MHIGIELRQPTLGASGGIALMLRDLLATLFAEHPEDRFSVFTTYYNADLLGAVPRYVQIYQLPRPTFFADLDRIARAQQIAVLFRSYPLEADLRFPAERQVVLIPDLQHELFPEFFAAEALRARRRSFNHALACAGAVGTLSEHARQSLRAHPWTQCDDIFLVSPALPLEHEPLNASELSAEERALLPHGDFFLYPANLWPHKNHRRVLEAFQLFLLQSNQPAALILTGDTRGWPELRASFPALPVHHLGFVRPQLLKRLYRDAQALVFFSLYEGFGMPLLEAFSAGTPVLCSNTSSLPEVSADAVLSCDPTDVQAISALMLRITQDEQLRAELIARGRQRLSAYSWRRSSQALYAALERVADTPRAVEPAAPKLPLVSIVTPSYNQGRFLRRTIESVLSQRYPRIEYIVIDGGSQDESVAILREYDGRVQWVSEPDAGQTDAINKGFSRVHGTICAYLNSDDVLLPGAIETVVGYFAAHPDCDMLYGRAQYIDQDDALIGMYATADYSLERLASENCICQPATFWRSRIAEKVGPLNGQLHYAMDYEYWLRIDRAGGQISHIHDTLAASRLYAETKTLSARAAIFREIFAICRAQLGAVHRNYFYGLWHYRSREQPQGWPRRLRRVPKSYQILARLDYWWYHRKRYTPTYIINMQIERIKRLKRCTPMLAAIDFLWSHARRVIARIAPLAMRRLDRALKTQSRSHIQRRIDDELLEQ